MYRRDKQGKPISGNLGAVYVRYFPFPTKCLALIVTVAVLSSCTANTDLRAFRNEIPVRIAGLDWPKLAPIGAFEATRDYADIPDPRSLAARASDLRARSQILLGPVLDPVRARAMRAALRRYYQG